jgi:hypothetical protein
VKTCSVPGCDAPAAESWYTVVKGVDYDGCLALFKLSRVECAAGHWYTEMSDGIHDPLPGTHL